MFPDGLLRLPWMYMYSTRQLEFVKTTIIKVGDDATEEDFILKAVGG